MITLQTVNTAFISSVIANFLFFSMGATLTWTSSVLPKLENNTETIFNESISSKQLAWITIMPTIGAAISGYFYTYAADYFGRKIVILSLGMPYLVSYLVMGLRTNLTIYYVFRFVLGIAAGGTFSVVPMYVIEMTTKYNRATLGSVAGVMISAGCLFSYSAGSWLSVTTFNLVLTTFPAGFFILFLTFGEETPYFYLLKNQVVLAERSLQTLRGDTENVTEEFQKIQETINEQSAFKKIEIIRNKTFIKNFTSTVGLFIFQQLTAMNALLMLNDYIFELSDISIDSSVCGMILGMIQFVSSFVTPNIGEKFGRKSLLKTSALLMSIFAACLGFYSLLADIIVRVQFLDSLPIILLSLFIVSYSLGFGPIPFIILSEILPWSVKTLVIPIVCTIYWGAEAIVITNFGLSIKYLGLGTCFLLVSFFCLLSVPFVHFCIEETRGKSLEEIQDSWKN